MYHNFLVAFVRGQDSSGGSTGGAKEARPVSVQIPFSFMQISAKIL